MPRPSARLRGPQTGRPAEGTIGRCAHGAQKITDRNARAGRFTTKPHLAVEQGQMPMSIVVTAGQRGDSPQFEPVLEKVRVPRIGSGRPRVRPNRARADRAYASRKNRAYLPRRGIRCTIPDKAHCDARCA
nr:transposase [Streptomyces sp. f51]